MPRFKLWFASALGAAALLAACASAPAASAPEPVTQIVSTTSFGMCVGYCTTRLEISERSAVLIREARGGRGAPDGRPPQRFETPLTPAEWAELSRLAAATRLERLPDVIGCPDCADGGAETLAIARAGQGAPRAVTFDFRAPIAEAGPLLTRVRAIRDRLTPAEH